jgi:hypothetical protein
MRLSAGQMRVQRHCRREVSTIFVDNPVDKGWRTLANARGLFLFPASASAGGLLLNGGSRAKGSRSPMMAQLCTNDDRFPCAPLSQVKPFRQRASLPARQVCR